MKLEKKHNELLFILSMSTFILYGIYALISLVAYSFVPLYISLILLCSLLITIFLVINYEIMFSDLEIIEEKLEVKESIEIDNSLVSI